MFLSFFLQFHFVFCHFNSHFIVSIFEFVFSPFQCKVFSFFSLVCFWYFVLGFSLRFISAFSVYSGFPLRIFFAASQDPWLKKWRVPKCIWGVPTYTLLFKLEKFGESWDSWAKIWRVPIQFSGVKNNKFGVKGNPVYFLL
jgi:hypothetical protein